MRDIDLAIIFPCFNEAENLEAVIEDAVRVFSKAVKKFRILIVDDGCMDGTGDIADELQKKHEAVEIIRHEKNRGYGAALISGFEHSRGDWVFYADGDGQFDLDEFPLLLEYIDDYDIIAGYRGERKDPLLRRIYGAGWNRLVRVLFKLPVRDINCAFKLVRKSVLDNLQLTAQGAVISAELLTKAIQNGARIKEVSVSHKPRTNGNASGGNTRVIFRAFIELLTLYNSLRNCRI